MVYCSNVVGLRSGPAVNKKNINFKNVRVTELGDRIQIICNWGIYHSMTYLFKVSKKFVSLIIPQVHEVLMNTLDANVKVYIVSIMVQQMHLYVIKH
jgi:hypothetical protein